MGKLEKTMTREQFELHMSTCTAECLQQVLEQTKPGDVQAILGVIDAYSYAHPPMLNVGDVKTPLLEAEIERLKPQVLVELGTFIGYGAVMFAHKMRQVSGPNAHVYSYEVSPEFAKVAQQLVDHAGLTDMVTIIVGAFGEQYAKIAERGVSKVDVYFIDHDKDAYLGDLKLIEQSSQLQPGSVIIADNVIAPGAPDYLEYIRANAKFETRFIETYLEYWKDIEDGIEIATYTGSGSSPCSIP